MSRYLVDTHAALWWLADDKRLSDTARELIGEPRNEMLVSAASLWEIAIKRQVGKLDAPDELPAVLEEEGFELVPITAAHAWAVRDLPLHHRDPFDRLLIAQALAAELPLISADADFRTYDIDVHW